MLFNVAVQVRFTGDLSGLKKLLDAVMEELVKLDVTDPSIGGGNAREGNGDHIRHDQGGNPRRWGRNPRLAGVPRRRRHGTACRRVTVTALPTAAYRTNGADRLASRWSGPGRKG